MGIQGPTGARGATGPAGATDFAETSVTTGTDTSTPKTAQANCAGGRVVVACFARVSGGVDDVGLVAIDRVLSNGELVGCTATAVNFFPPGSAAVTFEINWALTVRALCATVPQ